MTKYIVQYYAGTYNGNKTVYAEDQEDAISQVRTWVRKNCTLSMYSDGYKVINSEDEEEKGRYDD